MKTTLYKWFALSLLAGTFSLTSCLGDLDLKPIDENIIQGSDFKNHPEYYIEQLAKVYAGLAVSGQEGPAGKPDIEGFDEGMAQYLRAYWNLQELPTDEALLGWNDAGVPELSTIKWSSSNGFIYVMYSRIFFQIAQCNDFLRTTTPEALAENNVSDELAQNISKYRSEVRFLRALSYWHAIDLFGNVAFVTENDKIMEAPKQRPRAEIFNFLLSELDAIEGDIPLQPEYGRAGRGALWMLRAKLYLNAEIYTGTKMYTECANTCQQIIGQYGAGATHGLAPTYKFLFCADNDQFARGGAQGEILMVIPYDRDRTRTYGGTMYLTIGAYGGEMVKEDYGVNDGWGGPRSTSTLVQTISTSDDRYAFFGEGANIENTDFSNFQDGYAVTKFTNLLSTDWENTGKRAYPYPDTDFPIFRLADTYLMYAECAYRGYADQNLGFAYMNYIRERAHVTPYSSIADIDLNEIRDERMRELYWEGHRRTDLISFGEFTSGTYLWPWKGGVLGGKSVDIKYNLYPIPAKEIAANPGTQQNYGY